jgi:hypothetical protein
LKNTLPADYIITSEYYQPNERSLYKFDPDIRLKNIKAGVRNEGLEEVLTFSG